MKITIPYENGQVFQHFGHTQQFKIYDTDGETVTASQIVTPGMPGFQAPPAAGSGIAMP